MTARADSQLEYPEHSAHSTQSTQSTQSALDAERVRADFPMLQQEMRGKHSETGHPLRETTLAAFNGMAHFFESAQKRGEIKAEFDPLQLAEISYAVFRTTLQLWASQYWKADHNLEQRLNSAFDVLLKGMGADND